MYTKISNFVASSVGLLNCVHLRRSVVQRRLYLALRTLVIVELSLMGSQAQTGRQRINVDKARRLAQDAVKINNAGALLTESPRKFDPKFYFFAIVSNNRDASPIVGYLAVNPRTGDVWNIAGHCERLTSSALRRAQDQIRKRFGLTDTEYERLQAEMPICDAN